MLMREPITIADLKLVRAFGEEVSLAQITAVLQERQKALLAAKQNPAARR